MCARRHEAALIGVLIAALPGAVLGQNPPASGQTAEPPGGRVTLEEMLVVVGGRPVWRSAVQQEFDARLSGAESGAEGAEPTERDKEQLWGRVLADMIRDRMLAHGAMSLGFATPEEVAQYMDNFALQEERSLIRQLGSIDNVIRALEEDGMSWDAYMQQVREEQLTNLAINESVARRLSGQQSLFVTKKEMRAFYEMYKSQWVHGPRAALEVVAFRGGAANGNGSNGGAPAARAQAAAEAWGDGVSAQEIADRFGGIVSVGPWEFSSEVQDPRQPFFRNFALTHEEGEVSNPPIAHAGTLWLLRVSARQEASNLPFDDRNVQTYIQTFLENSVITRLRNETVVRSQNRTYIWPDPSSLSRIRR